MCEENKTIYFIYVDGTSYSYSENSNLINEIVETLKKTETNEDKYSDLKDELSKLVGKDFFLFRNKKDTTNEMNTKKVNKYTPSLREYLSRIPENDIVLVVESYIEYFKSKEIEEILVIYTIENKQEREKVKQFRRQTLKYYFEEGYYYPHKLVLNFSGNDELRCKYCGKKDGETTFDKRSHLISKSLYNFKYFDAQECTTCNQLFGRTIENSAVPFFQQLLKEKTNIKSETINMQHLYRLLVKISLGFLDITETDKNFSKTIAWIRQEDKNKGIKLPPILFFHINGTTDFTEPELFTYFRKDNSNKSLPFMYSIFHIRKYAFIYIVPTFSNDETNFSKKENFNKFIKELPQKKLKRPYKKLNCNIDSNEDINVDELLKID